MLPRRGSPLRLGRQHAWAGTLAVLQGPVLERQPLGTHPQPRARPPAPSGCSPDELRFLEAQKAANKGKPIMVRGARHAAGLRM